MSDGPTHFKNETVCHVFKGLKLPHHFMLPYYPWSNSAVERLGRELLCVIRSLISELQIDNKKWPDIIPLVQSILNSFPSPHRGNICLFKSSMGRKPTPPVLTFLRSATFTSVTVAEAQREFKLNIEEPVKLCADLHPHVQSTLTKQWKQSRKAAYKGQLPSFSSCSDDNYVLMARSDFHACEKLCLCWHEPCRVRNAINDYVYQVEILCNGHLDDIHASRLKLFWDSDIDEIAMVSHVWQTKTSMAVSRLLFLEDFLMAFMSASVGKY